MAALSQPKLVADYMCDISKNWFSFWKENAEKVCEDEEDITGKIVIVTGCNTGIGKMTALQLLKRGAVVIMAVRNLDKGKEALEDIKTKIGEKPITADLMQIDLGDLQSIREFVKNFEGKYSHLNILVNNAGFMDTNGKLLKTKDDLESHMGVNHLGSFLLTRLLLPSLERGSPSRIVCVSSSNLSVGIVDFEDFMMEKKMKTGDDGKEPYNNSKLASAMCMYRLAQTLGKDKGIKLVQLCPGYVKSDVFRNEKGILKTIKNSVSLAFVGLTPHQGCETVVYCSVAKKVVEGDDSGKGEIYRFKKLWARGNAILKNYDESEKATKLYEMSEEFVGLRERQSKAEGGGDGDM